MENKMKPYKSTALIKVLLILILPGSAYAQDIVLGVDFVNRYIWRGFDLGAGAPSLQPNVALTAGGLTVGFWGAYSLTNEVDEGGVPRPVDEIDFYGSYGFSLNEAGSLSIGFTDYMNPSGGIPFSNFNDWDEPDDPEDPDDGPGAHDIEINVGYSGPENFPIALSFNIFAYGVEDNPIYFQLGYNTSINDVGFSLFAGGTVDSSAYYGTDGFDMLNVGLTASKSIPITESFSLPIFGSVILNPSADHLFYVVGIKL
jgi:hypothetical protein